MYKIFIITLFPNLFKNFLEFGILSKAIKKKIIKINILNLINYKNNKRIDDKIYGGGGGTLIKCEPIYKAICEAKKKVSNNCIIIFLSPQGKILNNKDIKKLSKKKSLIIICGRYNGIDNRILKYIDKEISIGKYVLNGGEIPAMVLIETVIRFIPGVININSLYNDSFNKGLLSYSNYTKPKIFMNVKVPEVLLSGNHKKIKEWRIKSSIKNTFIKNLNFKKKENIKKVIKNILFKKNKNIKK